MLYALSSRGSYTAPSVTIDLSREGIIIGRMVMGTSGLLAEAHVQVNESAKGTLLGTINTVIGTNASRTPICAGSKEISERQVRD